MTIAFDAPSRTAATSGPPLRMARVERRVFPGTSAAALDPDLRVYLGDLARPYGLALREDLLTAGAGQSYGEMCAELVAAAVPDARPVDLLVLAYASPDIRPGRSTASYLSATCPGTPMAFAVTDQGAATAFTALRLIQQYVASGTCRRALLLVAEQATLHYEPPAGPPPVLPDRHAAVAIRFDTPGAGSDGPGLGRVRVRADVPPGDVAALIEQDRPDGAAVVAGPGLPNPELTGTELTGPVAPPGQPFTGAWWNLADVTGTVLVADYDPRLRYLATAEVTATG